MEKFSIESMNNLIARNKREIVSFQANTDLSGEYEFIGGLFNNTKNFLTNSLSSIGSWFAELQTSTPDPLPQFFNSEKTAKIISGFTKNEKNYLDYGTMEVQYIIGCDKGLKEIGDKLLSIPANHLDIVNDALDECDILISKVLSSDDFRASNTPIAITGKLKAGSTFIQQVDSVHSYLINPNDFVEDRMLNSICRNLKELDQSSDCISKLKSTLKQKELNAVLDKVEAISVKAKAIATDIEVEKITCTKAVLDGIKLYISTSANIVTALSTYYYLVSQYALVYNALGKKIEDIK